MSARLLTTEMLDELQHRLRDGGARVGEAWQPQRRSRDEIAERLGEVGLTLPTELATWWAWHDGVAGTALMDRLMGAWEPFSVDDAVADTRAKREIYGAMEDPPAVWSSSWVALGFDGSRGTLVCETAVPQGAPSPVHALFADGWDGPMASLPSLGELVSVWIDALREGHLRPQADGYFAYMAPAEKERIWGDIADLVN